MASDSISRQLAAKAIADGQNHDVIAKIVTLDGILAGPDPYFYKESGTGTSVSHFVIKPRLGIDHRPNRYDVNVLEPTGSIYVDLYPNGNQSISVDVNVPITTSWTHHVTFNVYDCNGYPRLRHSASTGTWVTTPFTTNFTSAYYVCFNVNDSGLYRSVLA